MTGYWKRSFRRWRRIGLKSFIGIYTYHLANSQLMVDLVEILLHV